MAFVKCSGRRSGRSRPGLLTSSVYEPGERRRFLDGRRDPAARLFQRVDVHAAGAVEDEPEDSAGEHHVVDLEAEGCDHRLHHALDGLQSVRHHAHLLLGNLV